jgi:hypothetical protein
MRRQIKDRGGGGGVRRGIEGVAACDEGHGSEANEGFARAGGLAARRGRRELWGGRVCRPERPYGYRHLEDRNTTVTCRRVRSPSQRQPAKLENSHCRKVVT